MEEILKQLFEGQNKLFTEVSGLKESHNQIYQEVIGIREDISRLECKIAKDTETTNAGLKGLLEMIDDKELVYCDSAEDMFDKLGISDIKSTAINKTETERKIEANICYDRFSVCDKVSTTKYPADGMPSWCHLGAFGNMDGTAKKRDYATMCLNCEDFKDKDDN